MKNLYVSVYELFIAYGLITCSQAGQIVYRLLVPSGRFQVNSKYCREVPAAGFVARIEYVGAVLGTLQQNVCQPILHGFLAYSFQRSTGDNTYMAL